MESEVQIAQFKGRLSQYLRAVQSGNEIVVKDRNTPIARVIPYGESRNRLKSSLPVKSLKDVDSLPFFRPKRLKLSDLEAARREDRRERFNDLVR
jgi:prevent-host-death family protein